MFHTVQALHGDPHEDNVVFSPSGAIGWVDFIAARIGPVAYGVAKRTWQSDKSEHEEIADA